MRRGAMSLTMWQQTVVACLRELTDTEQQKRSWLDQDGTEFPSPEFGESVHPVGKGACSAQNAH